MTEKLEINGIIESSWDGRYIKKIDNFIITFI